MKKTYTKPSCKNQNGGDSVSWIPAVALIGGLISGIAVGSMVKSDFRNKNRTFVSSY